MDLWHAWRDVAATVLTLTAEGTLIHSLHWECLPRGQRKVARLIYISYTKQTITETGQLNIGDIPL